MSGPVSPEMKTFARFKTARNNGSSESGKIVASGASFLNSVINVASRSPRAVVKTIVNPAAVARRFNSAQCASGHSFFGWLEATWQMIVLVLRQDFFGRFRQRRIGTDFGFERTWHRNFPAG